MPVTFRCPHRDASVFNHLPPEERRQARLDARREHFEVPADVKWEPVRDVRPTASGPELYDVGTYVAKVTCPVCRAELRVVTDKDVS